MDDSTGDDEKTYRLKIRLGDAEFEAQGAADRVNAQFEAFLEAFKSASVRREVAPAGAPTAGASAGSPVIVPAAGALGLNGSVPSVVNAAPIGDELLARVYRRDGDAISLLALPRTDEPTADALVALLYGYRRLLSRTAVNGYTLIRAARQSGIAVPRVDLALAKRQEFALAAGVKRGRVYSLNNPGVAYAEELVRKIVG